MPQSVNASLNYITLSKFLILKAYSCFLLICFKRLLDFVKKKNCLPILTANENDLNKMLQLHGTWGGKKSLKARECPLALPVVGCFQTS